MCAKEDETNMGPDEKPGKLEGFVDNYLNSYRSYLAEKKMDEKHMPGFYKEYPFVAEAYVFPNKAVCVLFKKSNRSKVVVLEGEYKDIKAKLDERSFDFMQVFPPYTNFSSDEAERLARVDADKDMKTTRRLEMLSATEAHIGQIHDDINSVLDLNPWLDEQTKSQKEKVEKAREMLNDLYKEVEVSQEERFSDYSRLLMEIMAFEKEEVEEVAGEMEVELESAMEGFEGRMSKVEEGFETFGKAMNQSMRALEQTVKEMKVKVSSISTGMEIPEEVETALKKALDSNKDNASKIDGLKRDIADIKKELVVFREIKETVFRDSKRTHNLNDRLSEIESDIIQLGKGADKEFKVQLKLLENRLNLMDKSVKNMVDSTIESEVENHINSMHTPPEITEEEGASKGSRIKKTTKKRTFKKTVR